jgi:hypothetical protein
VLDLPDPPDLLDLLVPQELRDSLESQVRSDLPDPRELLVHPETLGSPVPRELLVPRDLQELLVHPDHLEMMDLPDLWDLWDPRVFRDSLLAQLELLLVNLYPWESHKMLKISPWHWEKDFLKIPTVKKLSFSSLFKRTRWVLSLFHRISSVLLGLIIREVL